MIRWRVIAATTSGQRTSRSASKSPSSRRPLVEACSRGVTRTVIRGRGDGPGWGRQVKTRRVWVAMGSRGEGVAVLEPGEGVGLVGLRRRATVVRVARQVGAHDLLEGRVTVGAGELALAFDPD